jgi:hypothetical protein
LFAASEIGVAILTSVTSAEVRRYAQVPSDAVLNYVVTAGLIAFLAGMLRIFNSRLAAVALLLLSIGIFGFTAGNTASKTPSGNLFIAIVAIAVAIRAVQATVRLHDFADPCGAKPAPAPSRILSAQAMVGRNLTDDRSVVASQF